MYVAEWSARFIASVGAWTRWMMARVAAASGSGSRLTL